MKNRQTVGPVELLHEVTGERGQPRQAADINAGEGAESGHDSILEELGGMGETRNADVNEGRHRCHDPPRDHNAGNPEPRAPALHNQRAGNFEEEVTEEKNAGAKTDDRVVEPRQILHHRELREGDIGAIHERDDVGDKKERNESPVGFAAGAI